MEVDARLRRDGTSKIGAIDYADRAGVLGFSKRRDARSWGPCGY